MSSGVVGAAAAAILFPAVMAGLARAFPSRRARPTPQRMEQLTTSFRRQELFDLVVFFVGWPLVSMPLYKACTSLAASWPPRPAGTLAIWTMTDGIWIVVAMFLAFLPLTLLGVLLYPRILGRERWEEYLEYQEGKLGYDSIPVMCLLLTLTTVPVLVLGGFALDAWVRIEADAVVTDRMTELTPVRYPLDQLEGVYRVEGKIQEGEFRPAPHWYLRFQDGTGVHTLDYQDPDVGPGDQAGVAAALAARAGVEVSEVRTRKDVPAAGDASSGRPDDPR